MTRELGVAVIGAGVMGRFRIATVLANPRTTLRMVADTDAGRTTPWAGETRVVSDAALALDDPAVDLVIVSTPTHLHEPTVMAALDAGRHVLCEKPLAPTPAACARMVAAAEQAGRTLAVGFTHRYYPPFRHLRATLDAGVIGTLDYVRVSGGHPGLDEFRAPWMYEAATAGGGAMMDIGLHLTDLCGFLGCEIQTVYGTLGEGVWRVAGSEDHALAVMQTTGGVQIDYHASWTEFKGYRLCVDLYGTEGTARGYYAPMFNIVARRGRRRRFHWHLGANVAERLRGWTVTARRACADELDDLLRRLVGETVRLADGRDGWRAVAVAHAVYASARRRAPVAVGDPSTDAHRD